MDITSDHEAALSQLVESTYRVGAQTAILEAIKLLGCLGQHNASDALLKHHESIVSRAETHLEAQTVIRKARAA